MMYTEEQLQQIEYYASIYMTITDIAVILQIRAEELRSDIHIEDSPAYLAYHKGKAMSKVQLHAQEMTLAKVTMNKKGGSRPLFRTKANVHRLKPRKRGQSYYFFMTYAIVSRNIIRKCAL